MDNIKLFGGINDDVEVATPDHVDAEHEISIAGEAYALESEIEASFLRFDITSQLATSLQKVVDVEEGLEEEAVTKETARLSIAYTMSYAEALGMDEDEVGLEDDTIRAGLEAKKGMLRKIVEGVINFIKKIATMIKKFVKKILEVFGFTFKSTKSKNAELRKLLGETKRLMGKSAKASIDLEKLYLDLETSSPTAKPGTSSYTNLTPLMKKAARIRFVASGNKCKGSESFQTVVESMGDVIPQRIPILKEMSRSVDSIKKIILTSSISDKGEAAIGDDWKDQMKKALVGIADLQVSRIDNGDNLFVLEIKDSGGIYSANKGKAEALLKCKYSNATNANVVGDEKFVGSENSGAVVGKLTNEIQDKATLAINVFSSVVDKAEFRTSEFQAFMSAVTTSLNTIQKYAAHTVSDMRDGMGITAEFINRTIKGVETLEL